MTDVIETESQDSSIEGDSPLVGEIIVNFEGYIIFRSFNSMYEAIASAHSFVYSVGIFNYNIRSGQHKDGGWVTEVRYNKENS